MKLKKRKPCTPCRLSSLLTTRFGAVATSVIMPLMSAAELSGIMSLPALVPVLCAMRRATGMKIAVTAVELMVAPSPQTTTMSRTMRRTSSFPALAINQSPSRWATPVRTKPSPMTKSDLDNSTVEGLYKKHGPLALIGSRTKLMQHWADRIDHWLDPKKVMPIKGGAQA